MQLFLVFTHSYARVWQLSIKIVTTSSTDIHNSNAPNLKTQCNNYQNHVEAYPRPKTSLLALTHWGKLGWVLWEFWRALTSSSTPPPLQRELATLGKFWKLDQLSFLMLPLYHHVIFHQLFLSPKHSIKSDDWLWPQTCLTRVDSIGGRRFISPLVCPVNGYCPYIQRCHPISKLCTQSMGKVIVPQQRRRRLLFSSKVEPICK